jgi:hypothetical protein
VEYTGRANGSDGSRRGLGSHDSSEATVRKLIKVLHCDRKRNVAACVVLETNQVIGIEVKSSTHKTRKV